MMVALTKKSPDAERLYSTWIATIGRLGITKRGRSSPSRYMAPCGAVRHGTSPCTATGLASGGLTLLQTVQAPLRIDVIFALATDPRHHGSDGPASCHKQSNIGYCGRVLTCKAALPM